MWLIFLCLFLGYSLPSSSERCGRRTTDIKNVVVETGNEGLHLYTQGQQLINHSIALTSDIWNVKNFNLPPIKHGLPCSECWDMFSPEAHLLQMDLKKVGNILVTFRRDADAQLYFYRGNWAQYYPFYRIDHKQLIIEKCNSLFCNPCTTLIGSKKENNSGVNNETSSNYIYVSWALKSDRVTFLVQSNHGLLNCHDNQNVLDFQHLVLRGPTEEDFQTSSYNFYDATNPGSFRFEPSFNLSQEQSLQMSISLCKHCNMTVYLKDNNEQIIDEKFLSGRYFSKIIFEDEEPIFGWQEILIGGRNRNCVQCFLSVETTSSYNNSYWSIVSESNVITWNETETFCDWQNYTSSLSHQYNEMNHALAKALGENYRAYTSYCHKNRDETSCICPPRSQCLITIDVEKKTDPVIIKWRDNNSSELALKYRIELEERSSNSGEKRSKILRKPQNVTHKEFWRTPFFDLKPETIYEVKIFSDVCFNTTYFQTES